MMCVPTIYILLFVTVCFFIQGVFKSQLQRGIRIIFIKFNKNITIVSVWALFSAFAQIYVNILLCAYVSIIPYERFNQKRARANG